VTRTLAFKFGLAFVAVALIGVAIFAIIAVITTRARFDAFRFTSQQMALIDNLETYYSAVGSWDGVSALYAGPHSPAQGYASGYGHRGGGFASFVLTDLDGTVIVPGMGNMPGQLVEVDERVLSAPITYDGEEVGHVYIMPAELSTGPTERAFISGVTSAMVQSALVASLIALVLGVFLARTLTGPLRELTMATRALAKGDLKQHVDFQADDELGELAGAFNQMSADLSAAVDQRRQMTADIAHDLRTPLHVIMGYTESLIDGILEPTPETLAIIHDEARHLSRLVEDLRTLSLADAGMLTLMREETSVPELLGRVALAHRQQAQEGEISLVVQPEEDMRPADLDPDRMEQVLRNLVQNALRHTPAGGQVTLSAEQHNGTLEMAVQDTGAGIAPEHLPHIFDRFYRADKARGDSEESSGLGLAIARSLVRLHNGEIKAYSRPGMGARFVITIPSPA
jgi:signal transduction histidine kinase